MKQSAMEEDSYGNHQAGSYMFGATKMRNAKAKLDDRSGDGSYMSVKESI